MLTAGTYDRFSASSSKFAAENIVTRPYNANTLLIYDHVCASITKKKKLAYYECTVINKIVQQLIVA